MEKEKTTQEKTINIDLNKVENTTNELGGEQVFSNDLSFIKTSLFISNKIKKHTSTAPTYNPKNFNEQIVLYEDGATIRLYLWVNGTWRYVALT